MALADLGAALARSRARGTVDPTPLHRVMTAADAERVRAAAVEAYGGEACGYVMEATGARTRRRIGGDGPIWAPLLDTDLVAREPVRLPRGVMGAGCGLAFVLGCAFPEPGERVSRGAVEAALVSCRLAIQVLGRRVPDPVRLDSLTATADFALNVALHLGPRVAGWRGADLGGRDFTVRIDGQVVARGLTRVGRTRAARTIRSTRWPGWRASSRRGTGSLRRGRSWQPGPASASSRSCPGRRSHSTPAPWATPRSPSPDAAAA